MKSNRNPIPDLTDRPQPPIIVAVVVAGVESYYLLIKIIVVGVEAWPLLLALAPCSFSNKLCVWLKQNDASQIPVLCCRNPVWKRFH